MMTTRRRAFVLAAATSSLALLFLMSRRYGGGGAPAEPREPDAKEFAEKLVAAASQNAQVPFVWQDWLSEIQQSFPDPRVQINLKRLLVYTTIKHLLTIDVPKKISSTRTSAELNQLITFIDEIPDIWEPWIQWILPGPTAPPATLLDRLSRRPLSENYLVEISAQRTKLAGLR